MVIALDPDGCFDYVLTHERESAGKTTWRLGFLRGRELDAVRARADAGGLDNLVEAEQVVALALRGWTGLRDRNGGDVPFPPRVRADVFGCSCEVAAPEAMARLPLTAQDLMELLKAVMTGNQVGADAAKKSQSPQL